MKPPESIIPDGWSADDVSVTCPHGNRFEHDGSGPCGCTSFMREMGII